MKLEVGKFYKTREGNKAVIYAIHTENANGYVALGAVFDAQSNWVPCSWTIDGHYHNSRSALLADLVTEWVDPHPAESWPVDAKIFVWDRGDEDQKHKRHFAKYEHGKIYTFTGGATSWSDNKLDDLMKWDCAELAND